MSESDAEKNFKQLRDKVSGLEAERDAWKGLAVKGLVGSAGFDPSNKMVELVTEKFATDLESPEDIDIDAFGDFAKDYDLNPKTPSNDGGDADDGGSDDDEDFSDEMDKFQDRTKGLGTGEGGEPEGKQTVDKKVHALESEGDFDAAFDLKFEADLEAAGF